MLLFTKNAFKLAPLIITTLVESCHYKFPPANGQATLDGFEQWRSSDWRSSERRFFLPDVIISEIKCKSNDKVTACSDLNALRWSSLFGGFASHGNNGSIDFIFGNNFDGVDRFPIVVGFQYSRGADFPQARASCEVDLLLNGNVISSVPAGVLHLDNKENMPSTQLAVRPGDVVSIREVGHCAFVLESMEYWSLTEGYDSSKKTSYFSLTGQSVSASSHHRNHGPERAVDGSGVNHFTSRTKFITKERAWFKVSIPGTVPGNNIVGFQIYNRPCCQHPDELKLVNVEIYLIHEGTAEEVYCGKIGTEGVRKKVDFKFSGDCLAPRGGQILKLLAPMNWKGATRSVLTFEEIRLMYQEVKCETRNENGICEDIFRDMKADLAKQTRSSHN